MVALAWTVLLGLVWLFVPAGQSTSVSVSSDGTLVTESSTHTLLENEGAGLLVVLAGLAASYLLGQTGLPGVAVAAGAVGAGVLVTFAHQRWAPGRMYLRYLSPLPILVVGVFLFASPVATLVLPSDEPTASGSGSSAAARAVKSDSSAARRPGSAAACSSRSRYCASSSSIRSGENRSALNTSCISSRSPRGWR